jgi:hypothetical protein
MHHPISNNEFMGKELGVQIVGKRIFNSMRRQSESYVDIDDTQISTTLPVVVAVITCTGQFSAALRVTLDSRLFHFLPFYYFASQKQPPTRAVPFIITL